MPFAKRLALLFAAGLLTLGAAPAQRDSLSSLLARMRERSGPVWAAHLTSVSHVMQNGVTVDLRSETQGLRFASYHCAGALCDGTYFDGERLYSININGTTLPDPDGADSYLRAERTIASLSFLAPDFVERGGTIYDDGVTDIDGVRYRTILVANKDAVPMLVFVDPKTATIRYMRDINGDQTFEYRKYAAVDGGFYLPLYVLRNGNPLERYDKRESLSTPFVPPHGPLPTFSSRPVTIQTDPTQTIPVFDCTIAGIAAKCLLDSGNSGLSISLALAERLEAPVVGSFQVRGLGNYATEVVRAGALDVGGMSLPPANYVVLHDIDHFGYQVVLGADVFAATTIRLETGAHRVVFGAPDPQDGVTVPLAFDNFVPVVDVRLGALPTRLAFDTGDESSINLAYDFYQAHRDLFSATSEREVQGVGGGSVELLGTIPQVQIGDLAVDSAVIGATQTLQGTARGHLGEGLMSRFDVTIDYAAGELHFVPLNGAAPAPTPSP
jgi:Aspartyl protease